MINRRTRDILIDAAEELFETQIVQNISVQSVVDKCGTTRTTFYRYFKDKYDIMNSVYKRKVDNIIREYIDSDDIKQMYCDILTYMENRKQYYSSIVKYSGQNSFYEYIVEYGADFFEKRLLKKIGEDAVTHRIHRLVLGYCYGSGHLIIDWLNENCNIGIDDFANLLIDLGPASIAEHLF
jgi:AcrR family transcriptional regulator